MIHEHPTHNLNPTIGAHSTYATGKRGSLHNLVWWTPPFAVACYPHTCLQHCSQLFQDVLHCVLSLGKLHIVPNSISWWYSPSLWMYRKCSTPFIKVSCLNCVRYFHATVHFTLMVSTSLHLSPANIYWYIKFRVGFLHYSLAIMTGVAWSKILMQFYWAIISKPSSSF